VAQTAAEILGLISEGAGVRGALIATGDGVYPEGDRSGLDRSAAADVAKTVRRMIVASATVGAPLKELIISLGAAQMMILPLDDTSTVVILLERNVAPSAVRERIGPHVETLVHVMAGDSDDDIDTGGGDSGDDEVDAVLHGELGPVLEQISECYRGYILKTGRNQDQTEHLLRGQLQEWLLCCNPSAYTFPLLLDGLSQTMNDAPDERGGFVSDVHAILRKTGAWTG
jgi:hypothetical protein